MGAKRTKTVAPSFVATGDDTLPDTPLYCLCGCGQRATQALRVLNAIRVQSGLPPRSPDELSVERARAELARPGVPSKGRGQR
jgi:hypothetical protein